MGQAFPYEFSIENSVINLHEAAPSPGFDDTTRVVHFAISNPQYHETVQVFTPRSNIADCRFLTSGPIFSPVVRIWKGGRIQRNYFGSFGDAEGFEARHGAIVIAWNTFEGMTRAFSIYNETASETASVLILNNTIHCYETYVGLRTGSSAEIVNNILLEGVLHCSGSIGTMEIRYNDFFDDFPGSCQLGPGNIYEDPLFCDQPSNAFPWPLQPDSPCAGTGENGANMGAGEVCGVYGIETTDSPRAWPRLRVEPNPVHFGTEFTVDGGTGPLRLEIYDSQGRMVELLSPFHRQVSWFPKASAPRGIYFARVRWGDISDVVKFLVIR
jgi:hypothetical protein